MLKNNILTKGNLLKRGWDGNDLCQLSRHGEPIDHLIFWSASAELISQVILYAFYLGRVYSGIARIIIHCPNAYWCSVEEQRYVEWSGKLWMWLLKGNRWAVLLRCSSILRSKLHAWAILHKRSRAKKPWGWSLDDQAGVGEDIDAKTLLGAYDGQIDKLKNLLMPLGSWEDLVASSAKVPCSVWLYRLLTFVCLFRWFD